MTDDEKINEAFRLLKELVESTGVNMLDNYAYREWTTIKILKQVLHSIEKIIGRTGDDASAAGEGYKQIEMKSGTNKRKTLTISAFPKMLFDKQNDAARRQHILTYDGLVLSFFEFYNPSPVAVILVPKQHVSKLHPLIKEKQDIKIESFNALIAAGKNIGHDAISISLDEIIEKVGGANLMCWLKGQQIDSITFINMMNSKKIKINQ
jgi:hypothetical protein